MLLKKSICNIALTILTVAILGVAGWSQVTKPTPNDDINKKPRKVRPEAKDAFKKFLDNDAAYIITAAERKAFLALATDDERGSFIENFWRRRDPDPDTEENEYREEHFERIAYANEHFASGIPGWKTDRGRIYIAWGKPDSIESHPSGGAYDRPSYAGYGSTTTYPFEIWFYRHLDGVGDGIEIEFVDPTGTGEYRIARDANEKDALKYVPGAGNTLAEQLNIQTRADRLMGFGQQGYMRSQDMPFERMRIEKDLSTPPRVKFTDLQKVVGTDSPVVDVNPVDFDLRIDFFRQSEDKVVTTFTVQAPNKELQFKESGGFQTASMNIFGRITAVSEKRSGIFEDSVSQTATVEELVSLRDRQSIYQRAIALAPGTYKVDVVVRDVNSGSTGKRSLGFTVPRYEDKKLSTSSLILTSSLRVTNERDIGQRFVVGNLKVIPNLTGIYKRGQSVGVYLQVYNAEIDQTTLRPAVDVEYVVSKDGKELFRQKEDWSGMSDSGQRLTLARILPTDNLTIGEYEIKIITRDRVRTGSQVIENRSRFTVTQ